MSSAKWRLFRLGLNALRSIYDKIVQSSIINSLRHDDAFIISTALISSSDDLLPVRCQAITDIDSGLTSIELLGINIIGN